MKFVNVLLVLFTKNVINFNDCIKSFCRYNLGKILFLIIVIHETN